MTTLTVGALNVDHSGTVARITFSDGSGKEGTLMFAANPSYQRRIVRHWWLIVPSAHPRFESDAISLQWSESAAVELLEEVAA